MTKKQQLEKVGEVSDMNGNTTVTYGVKEEPQEQTSAMHNPLFKMQPQDFSGIARSVECYLNQGNNNFRVLTMYIDKGKVVKIEVSDPFAQWEAGQKLDHWNDMALINLNNNWKNGKTFQK